MLALTPCTSCVPQPQAEAFVRSSAFVPLPDGARLAGDFYVPSDWKINTSPPLPVVLAITQASRHLDLRWPLSAFLRPSQAAWRYGSLATRLVPREYAFVVVDARGTGASEGIAQRSLASAEADVRSVIEWIARESWCNGTVLLVGRGADALFALLGAAAAPSPLAAALVLFPRLTDSGPRDADSSFVNHLAREGRVESSLSSLPKWAQFLFSLAVSGPTPVPQPIKRVDVLNDPSGSIALAKRIRARTAGLVEHQAEPSFSLSVNPGSELEDLAARIRSNTGDLAVPIFLIAGTWDGASASDAIGIAQSLPPEYPVHLTIGPWTHGATKLITVSSGLQRGEPSCFDTGAEVVRIVDAIVRVGRHGTSSHPEARTEQPDLSASKREGETAVDAMRDQYHAMRTLFDSLHVSEQERRRAAQAARVKSELGLEWHQVFAAHAAAQAVWNESAHHFFVAGENRWLGLRDLSVLRATRALWNAGADGLLQLVPMHASLSQTAPPTAPLPERSPVVSPFAQLLGDASDAQGECPNFARRSHSAAFSEPLPEALLVVGRPLVRLSDAVRVTGPVVLHYVLDELCAVVASGSAPMLNFAAHRIPRGARLALSLSGWSPAGAAPLQLELPILKGLADDVFL